MGLENTDHIAALLLFLSVNLFGGMFLGRLTKPNIPWYNQLNQPSFRPPNWLFGPVWTVIYSMVAVSGWRIYIKDEFNGVPMAAYITQLLFNFVWTLLFFVWKQLFLGIIDIALL